MPVSNGCSCGQASTALTMGGMKRTRALTTLLAALVVAGASLVDMPAAQASTVHVVTTTTDTVDPDDGLLSLREAVALGATDDTESEIVLQAGTTYVLDGCAASPEDLNVSGDLDFGSDDGTL